MIKSQYPVSRFINDLLGSSKVLGSLLWIWLLASQTQDCLLGLGCLHFTPGAVIGSQTSRGAGIFMLGSSAAAALHFHQQILQGSKPQLLCMTSLFLALPMLPRLHLQQWPLKTPTLCSISLSLQDFKTSTTWVTVTLTSPTALMK